MKSIFKFGAFALCALNLIACSARPIQSGVISESRTLQETVVVPVIEKHEVKDAESEISLDELAALNKSARSPTFGIIKGFYQLPEVFPQGAISVERARSFGFDYKAITIKKLGSKAYAVTPTSAIEAEAMAAVTNRLLDAGVRFSEISMADAMKIMKAERRALASKVMVFPGSSVPSGVDLLLSFEKGYGNYGPIYVGRVIRTRDGQLLALLTVNDVGTTALGSLVSRLVKDSLRRLGAQK